MGLNPSNWESGLSASPSRPMTKTGPAELRLAYYQAANVARRHDPELADFYPRLMVVRHGPGRRPSGGGSAPDLKTSSAEGPDQQRPAR